MAMTRRETLRLLGCSAAAFPLATPMTFAAVPGDSRLVVVVLRGALDGLDALRPVGDPGLARLRPGIAAGDGVALTGFHALHPGLAALEPLWRAGELGFAQAVATPYRDKRSHFDGQDVLESGTAGLPAGQRGWMNRMLEGLADTGVPVDARTALAVGRDEMLILRGPARHASWAPDEDLGVDGATADLLRHVHHDDPLFRQALDDALGFSTDGRGRGGRQTPEERLFGFAATQLRRDARIAALSVGGWDTHRAQPRRLRQGLARLAGGLLKLRDDLGRAWDRTTVLMITEFGRTAAENGTMGTDHGTGGTMILAGGALRGGRVWGAWPGLDEADLLDRRDLMPLRDVRAYAGWAMRDAFGLDRALIERAVFPGLEMGDDPRLLG